MSGLGDKFGAFPVMAILRGLQPDSAVETGRLLIENGIGALEVPLNRPGAVESIAILAKHFGAEAAVGAGTVISEDQVLKIGQAGATFAVSPHTDPVVIAATKEAGLLSIPGVATPTEAYLAIRSGADFLKIFPCDHLVPAAVRAVSAILPEGTPLLCVGGIDETNIAAFLDAGASGFGIGSALYRPGMTAHDVSTKIAELREAAERPNQVSN